MKASDDPVTASNLSAKREQKILLERFIKNGNTAKTRLDLADSGLNQVINVLTRFSELSIQAANDTNGVDDRLAMVKGNGGACYSSIGNNKYTRCKW